MENKFKIGKMYELAMSNALFARIEKFNFGSPQPLAGTIYWADGKTSPERWSLSGAYSYRGDWFSELDLGSEIPEPESSAEEEKEKEIKDELLLLAGRLCFLANKL